MGPGRARRTAARLWPALIAFIVAGCGSTIEIGDLRIGLPGPDASSRPPGGEISGDISVDRLPKSREAALDDLIERLTDPDHIPEGDVVLRLSLTGGWELPHQDELHLSIEDDGRVVRVTDTSVFSSTRDYTSLRLRPTGIVRVLETIRPLLASRPEEVDGGAGVSPSDRSAWLEVGSDLVLSMDRLGQTVGYDAAQQERRAAFASVIEGIRDLAWLGDDIEVVEAPWVPESMTVLATPRGSIDAAPEAVPWPLERSIEELAGGTQVGPSGEERHVLCLVGAEVAPVFDLLTGLNHARLRVADGDAWELDVQPHYPGYRRFSDPCAA